jgi:curli biogenesis system outer membrane secretion channel CsgG
MTKLARRAALALVLSLLTAATGFAQTKIRVAIWDFENNSEGSWWYSERLGPAARNQIDTAFSENAKLSDMFSVVEREKLDLVLKEQGLGSSGALDQASAAKIGRILGVKYIVTGGVDKFSVNQTGGGIGMLGVGGNVMQADATINVRFIDTTTAERVFSVAAEAEVRKGGGFVKGVGLSRDSEWGLASETVEKASKAVVTKLLAGNYLARLSGGGAAVSLEGKVAKVDGNRAWINIGSSSGVKAGDKFRIFAIGEELLDPDTGQKLGADEKESGTGAVTEVQEKFAVITFTGAARVKDVVRKQ